MTRWQRCALLATLILILPRPAPPLDARQSSVVAIEGATVIDGVSQAPIADAVIVIEGDTILDVGPRARVKIPPGARTVAATGKIIIPGIFNLHGHVGTTEGMESNARFYTRDRVQRDAQAYLYYGITHMVSLGNDHEPMAPFLADQRAGRAGGARLHSAGFGFAAPKGWQPTNPRLNRPSTPEEARELLRKEVQKKPDLIKIWVDDGLGTLPKLVPDVYAAIIDEAHKYGLKVLVHMYALEDAKELLRRGVDALAHSVRDRPVDEEFLRLARERRVTQIATLAGHSATLAYADGADFLDDPGLPVLFPPGVLETVRGKDYRDRFARDPAVARTRAQYEMALRNTARVAAAGIPIGLGTDSGSPGRFQGLWEHREMELLVKAGLTPLEAIRAATINGARFLGLDRRYGSLERDKGADFLVLSANPLADIRNSRKIEAVWMSGKPIDRSGLAMRTAPSAARE